MHGTSSWSRKMACSIAWWKTASTIGEAGAVVHCVPISGLCVIKSPPTGMAFAPLTVSSVVERDKKINANLAFKVGDARRDRVHLRPPTDVSLSYFGIVPNFSRDKEWCHFPRISPLSVNRCPFSQDPEYSRHRARVSATGCASLRSQASQGARFTSSWSGRLQPIR